MVKKCLFVKDLKASKLFYFENMEKNKRTNKLHKCPEPSPQNSTSITVKAEYTDPQTQQAADHLGPDHLAADN